MILAHGVASRTHYEYDLSMEIKQGKSKSDGSSIATVKINIVKNHPIDSCYVPSKSIGYSSVTVGS